MASLHQLVKIHKSLSTAHFDPAIEYQSQANLNLYDSPELDRLATQVLAGRYLRIISLASDSTGTGVAIKVCLCEDNYSGWLALQDLDCIQEATTTYCPIALSGAEIQARIPDIIAFAQAQMMQTNSYLWGGTIGPNYDCSGLVQRSFSSLGIWLPRDAYQQETFTQPVLNSSSPVALSALKPGDLVFFGPPQRANHVGIYLGEGHYIHSSGENQGRNGIGIDQLTDQGNSISRTYYQQLRGAGRVVACYQSEVSV